LNLHDWYKRVDIASQQATRQRGSAQPNAVPQEAQALGEAEPVTEIAPGKFPKKQAKPSDGKSRKALLRRVEGGRDAPALNAETREQLLSRLLDPILSLEEAAKVLNVCPTTVRRYTNSGALAHLRTQGNQRRFLLSDVLAFLKSQQDGTPRMPSAARQRQTFPSDSARNAVEMEPGS
jgi:excisionase family DNA binding protein